MIGDHDIACISYFPDYDRTPQEGFLLLENTGGNVPDFIARTTPGATSGKWLVADRADYDQDGDIDIVLGNSLIMSLNVPEQYREKWAQEPTTILLLENTTR